MSVIGEVMNNAVKEAINKKETQTRPMNLCGLAPFFLKKIYKPTGTAANAKKHVRTLLSWLQVYLNFFICQLTSHLRSIFKSKLFHVC